MRSLLPVIIVAAALSASCNSPAEDGETRAPTDSETTHELPAEQQAFWQNIRQHCGNAYAGRLADATPYYSEFAAERITIHFRNCPDTLTHISLHLDDDHSRNLMITNMHGALRLKHDHRHSDGSGEIITNYGGDAPKPGLETRQIFLADNHTAYLLPDRFDNFWFIDLMEDETLAYGVHWPKFGHSIRMEFDLTTPVEEPPAPWGY